MLGLQVCNNREVMRLNPILRIQQFRRKEAQEVFHQVPKSEGNGEHQEKKKTLMFDAISLVLEKEAVHTAIAIKPTVSQRMKN